MRPQSRKAPVRLTCVTCRIGKLADFGKRMFGRGDRSVLRILVNKDFKIIAGLEGRTDIARGQKHLISLLVLEICAEIDIVRHAQRVIFSYL